MSQGSEFYQEHPTPAQRVPQHIRTNKRGEIGREEERREVGEGEVRSKMENRTMQVVAKTAMEMVVQSRSQSEEPCSAL